jgi:hypothetical protein
MRVLGGLAACPGSLPEPSFRGCDAHSIGDSTALSHWKGAIFRDRSHLDRTRRRRNAGIPVGSPISGFPSRDTLTQGSAISDAAANGFDAFLQTHSQLRLIAFNGATTAALPLLNTITSASDHTNFLRRTQMKQSVSYLVLVPGR